MKRLFWLLLPIIFASHLAMATTYNIDCQPIPYSSLCTIPATAGMVQGDVLIISNKTGAVILGVELVFTGSPSSVSIPVAGCNLGGTCDTLGTYTGTSNTNYSPTSSKAYATYQVTITTLSGGTSPTVSVGGSLTTANLPGGGGGGSGTVTTVSSGNLSPLFTVGIANPTTTPAFTFTLSNAAQNAFLAGPSSAGAGAPTYRAIVAADVPTSLPSLAGVGTITSGIWSGSAIGALHGGTGQNSSSSTGVAQVSSGTWSFNTALANGTTATTQAAADNTTDVATDAFVLANGSLLLAHGNGTVTLLGTGSAPFNLATVQMLASGLSTGTYSVELWVEQTTATGGTCSPTGTLGAGVSGSTGYNNIAFGGTTVANLQMNSIAATAFNATTMVAVANTLTSTQAWHGIFTNVYAQTGTALNLQLVETATAQSSCTPFAVYSYRWGVYGPKGY